MRLPWVAWVDPSKLTGVALLYPNNTWWAGEAPFPQAAGWIMRLATEHGPELLLGCERYYIIPGLPHDDAHHAIEMIGVVRYAGLLGQCRAEWADPKERKTATMAMLKRAGWWPKGKDAQSASQHLAAYLQRTGNLPPSVAAAMSARSGTV